MSATTLKMKFVLVGAHAGKTINLGQDGRYAFKDGVLEMEDGADIVLGVANVLKQFYSAYPASEAKEAQDAYDEAQAALKPSKRAAAAVDDDEEEAETKTAKGGRKK